MNMILLSSNAESVQKPHDPLFWLKEEMENKGSELQQIHFNYFQSILHMSF